MSPPREVTGDRDLSPPVQLSPVQLYPPLPQFSFEGGSATSRGRKQCGLHSPMFRGMSRNGPSPGTTVGRAEGRPQPQRDPCQRLSSLKRERPRVGSPTPTPGISESSGGGACASFGSVAVSVLGVVQSLQQREQPQGSTRLQPPWGASIHCKSSR